MTLKRRLMRLVIGTPWLKRLVFGKPDPKYIVCDFGLTKELDRLMLDQLLTELNGAVAIAEEKSLPEEYNPTEEKR